MIPKIRTTSEAKLPYLKACFYGLPGSGKTTLAATFPAPVFLTLESSIGEMRSISDVEMPVITFNEIQEFVNTINWIADQIERRKPIGPYVPLTVVLDNWTSFLNAWEVELIDRRSKSDNDGIKRMRNADWGDLFMAGMQAKVKLHRLPINVVHLCHAKEREYDDKVGNKTVKKISGTYDYKGNGGHAIVAECSVVSYLESIDRGTTGTGFYAHLKPYKHWKPIRCHAPPSSNVPSRLGPGTPDDRHPHYDDFAEIFGMPTVGEAEDAAGIDWS